MPGKEMTGYYRCKSHMWTICNIASCIVISDGFVNARRDRNDVPWRPQKKVPNVNKANVILKNPGTGQEGQLRELQSTGVSFTFSAGWQLILQARKTFWIVLSLDAQTSRSTCPVSGPLSPTVLPCIKLLLSSIRMSLESKFACCKPWHSSQHQDSQNIVEFVTISIIQQWKTTFLGFESLPNNTVSMSVIETLYQQQHILQHVVV